MSDETGAERGNPSAGGDTIGPAHPRHGLADFLIDRDVGCFNCGFNLRALTGDRCPECNTRIQLVIASPDALWRLRHWIVASLAIMLLATLVSIASFISMYVTWGSTIASWRMLVSFATNVGLGVALIIVLVRHVLRHDAINARRHLLVALIGAILVSSSLSVISNLLWIVF